MSHTKICNRCHQNLHIDLFYNSAKARDHRQAACKTCCSKYSLERQRRKRVEWNAYYNEYSKKRRSADPAFRLAQLLRSNLRHYIKRSGAIKSQNTERLLGCDWLHLKNHIESLFTAGMSWDLLGDAIHIDHIRPVSSFDLTDPVQQRQCFHYTNLQPLWASDNLRKHAQWEKPK